MTGSKRTTKKKHDKDVKQILDALEAYTAHHPRAVVEAYRRNSASIRVRIVDPDFKGIDRIDREVPVWAILDTLPEEVKADISMLVLVTPPEAKKSGASLEFEDPAPSLLD